MYIAIVFSVHVLDTVNRFGKKNCQKKASQFFVSILFFGHCTFTFRVVSKCQMILVLSVILFMSCGCR